MSMSSSPTGRANPLAAEFSLWSLLKFAMPSVVTMLFMGLYTICDTVFVARFVNTDALSALNIVCPVVNLTVGLGTMLAAGGSAVIARKIGAGREAEACRDLSLLVLAAAVLGTLLALLGLLFLDRIIRALGASCLLYPYCRAYLLPLLLFTPASILQVLFQTLLIAAGKPGLGMAVSIGAGAANVLLDLLFMGPLGLGITGSALGTGLGCCIPAVLGAGFFFRSRSDLRFGRPAPDFPMLFRSCANGASELVSQLSAAVTTFLFNRTMLRLLGEDGVAAITIIIYAQFLLSAVFLGFSMGTAPVISYCFGSRNHPRLIRVFRICLSVICGTSVILFMLSMALGPDLVRLFTPGAPAVYSIARKGFLIFPFSFLFCGINIFASAAFTALSNGRVSALLSLLRTFGFLTAALLILPRLLRVSGVWLAVPLAEFITLFLSAGFLLHWKRHLPD